MYDYSWGSPFCVREALKHYYKRDIINTLDIDSLCYSPEEGNPELVKLTRQFIEKQTGISYNHILITHGTTSAINIVLRVMKDMGKNICYTHPYYFPYYPDIIGKNKYEHRKGLYQLHRKHLGVPNTIGIVDSPSNPEGDLVIYSNDNNNIIWDSVYHSNIFINGIGVKPEHRVNCGSYSKYFGLTGVRVGWIATNDKEDFDKFVQENKYETAMMSQVSQNLIIDIFKKTDLENFSRSAKYRINNNREYFSKINNLFDGQEVPDNGMFYSVWCTRKTLVLLDYMQIKYVELDQNGVDKLIRFNLAQTNELTRKMTKQLAKEDKIEQL